MDVQSYQNLAQEKHKVHQKFLQKLKNKKPKQLDVVTQKTHNQVFDEIDCLQCANCCKTTGPLVTERDIERISKHFRLKPSEFIQQYLRRDEDGDWVLQTLPCPFLDEDNKCSIYDFRPKACREFPHTDRKKLYQINHLTIKNTKICPAAYLVLERLMENLGSKI